MNVTLREITRDNFEECCDLDIAENQKAFVSSNTFSLAESKFFPEYVPLAIYAGDTMVGFLMYGQDELDGESVWMLMRFMVDRHYQGRGYGRAAMQLLVEEIRTKSGSPSLYTSIMPGNTIAQNLYSSLGFEDSGDIEDGELVLRFRHRERRRN